jgi:hypothetical protein
VSGGQKSASQGIDAAGAAREDVSAQSRARFRWRAQIRSSAEACSHMVEFLSCLPDQGLPTRPRPWPEPSFFVDSPCVLTDTLGLKKFMPRSHGVPVGPALLSENRNPPPTPKARRQVILEARRMSESTNAGCVVLEIADRFNVWWSWPRFFLVAVSILFITTM